MTFILYGCEALNLFIFHIRLPSLLMSRALPIRPQLSSSLENGLNVSSGIPHGGAGVRLLWVKLLSGCLGGVLMMTIPLGEGVAATPLGSSPLLAAFLGFYLLHSAGELCDDPPDPPGPPAAHPHVPSWATSPRGRLLLVHRRPQVLAVLLEGGVVLSQGAAPPSSSSSPSSRPWTAAFCPAIMASTTAA